MKLHASGEDYRETILVLHKKTGMVRSVDVARRLEVSKPSVCHAVAALKKICRMAAWRWGWRKKGKPCLSVPHAAKSPAKSRRIPQTSCFRGWKRKICSWPLRPLWMFPPCQIAPAAFSRCQCASLRRTDFKRQLKKGAATNQAGKKAGTSKRWPRFFAACPMVTPHFLPA